MGTGQEAEDRFWKNVFAGAASVRFHRPGAGLGLSTHAQSNIKSMQVFLSEFDLFNSSPYEGIKMYGASEGYALGNIGKQYAIYFPVGRYGEMYGRIKSMQVFLSEFDLFNASPYEGIKMYGASEGYALGNIGKQYAIYLPQVGMELNLIRGFM
jgi:hypothetical protein